MQSSYLLLLPLLISTIIAIGLAFYAWPRRTTPGAITIFLQTLGVAFWSFGYAMEMAASPLAVKILWAKFQYLGIVMIPVMVFIFALQYRGYDIWVRPRFVAPLLFIPVVTLVLVWTNELHLLIWKEISINVADAFPILHFEYGPAFWVQVGYAYLMVFAGSALLFSAFFRSRGIYKKQSLIMLLGALAPWIGNVLYLLHLPWLNNLDLTPFAFTITVLFYSWGQFRFQLLDLAPIARDAIIENMSDAVIVLDIHHRIVDINPAARVLISSKQGQIIGEPVENVFLGQQEFAAIYRDHQNTPQAHTEIFLDHPGDPRLFDLRISQIRDRRGHLTARFIVLRDISERWRAEKAIQKARDELEKRVKERTSEIQANYLLLQQEIAERAEIVEALRLERDKAQKYLHTAQVILLALNATGEVTLINPYGLEILGYPEEEILGKNWFDLCVPDEIREEIHAWYAALLREPVDKGVSRQYPARTKEGEIRHVAWQGAPLTSDGGQVTSILFSGEHVTDRLVAEERLRYNALHDPLTGLPNRTYFLDRLTHSIHWASTDTTHRFAVLFLDLDSFKLINDSFGHTVGDKMLVAIARRLERCVRSGDVIARLAGDEFFILLDQIWSPSDASQVAEAILQELQQPLSMDLKTFRITCSIGIVLCNERNQFVEDILRDADIAMYQAKARGKASYAFFVPDMRTRPLARLKLENVLRDSVEQKDFTLNYQPILSLQDNRLFGFEALLRWRHPEQGIISPVEFIPILEETGMIIPVGEWTLNQAGQKIGDWQARMPSNPLLSISVNISGRQFTHPTFTEKVRQVLVNTGLNPLSLKIELTESVLLNDTELARTVLFRLKDMGVQVHIDDFGTGYSSLSYLRTLTFDAIKIDRSFINQIDTEKNQLEIVKSILALANTIGASTVAEGVETETQLDCLKSMGCQYGQGYFIARPFTAAAAEAFLVQYREKYAQQAYWYQASQTV